MEITNHTTIYAKWLKRKETIKVDSFSFKNDEKSISVTPTGFDLNELSKRGYKIKITITYNVEYDKDYDVLFNIGYMGAPKHEASLRLSGIASDSYEDRKTSSGGKTETLEIKCKPTDLLTKAVIFKVGSNNIQNKIYVSNINVTYECYQ